jgi:hypothetical protein
MGVNCDITLPGNARVKDVAQVIGRLSGCAAEKKHFSQGGGWYTEVKTVNVKPSTMPECCYIYWQHNEDDRAVLYHFEWESSGNRGLSPNATAWWIAAAKRLVDFFGGSVDFSDCDSIDVDYAKEPSPLNGASDGQEWEALHQAILDVQPITEAELDEAEKHAAYKDARAA